MVDENNTPALVAAPVPAAKKADSKPPSETAPPFRHATCAGCGKAIADDQAATVYPYVDESYHTVPCNPAVPPPMPAPAVEEDEA